MKRILRSSPALPPMVSIRIYVQPDPYVWSITCYDPDLKPIWQVTRRVMPLPKIGAELAEVEAQETPQYAPSRRRHMIRRLVARPDGELWVESDHRNEQSGEMWLERFGADGSSRGVCHIVGGPDHQGRFGFYGDRVLWVADADGLEAGMPYLIVFRLDPDSSSPH